MKKNVASQVIGVQMVSATDGSAFTGSVTVSVTGDGGTQATGSVGSGACTHEGNGFHTYAPAQAETNYDHVAFTFTGTGAVPVTVQVYPTFPQTGDAFDRLGAPAGASVSADIAAIEAQTDDIGAAGAGLTSIPWNASWDAEVQSEVADALAAYDPPTNAEMEARTLAAAEYATASALATVAGYLDTEIAAILEDTGTTIPGLIGSPAGASLSADVAAVKSDTAAILTDTGTTIPAQIGTPVGADLSADIAAVKAQTAAIEADTQNLQSRTPAALVGGRMDANVGAVNATALQGDGSEADPWRPA